MAEFEHLEELVVGLHERGDLGFAESEDEFITVKSGRLSPTFFNGRGIMSRCPEHPMSLVKQGRVTDLTIDGYAHMLDQIEQHDHIINLPQAVNPIVGAIALKSGYSLLYLRTQEGEKGYGKHEPIEGLYSPDESVIGIDNVISDSKTKTDVAKTIEAAGLRIPIFAVLLDREEGGEATLNHLGYDLASVVGMRAATQILLDAGRIRPEQARWSFDYIDRYNIPV